MYRFKSLTTKFIFISTILLIYITVVIVLSFLFTNHIRGEATRINLAGQLRFRAFEMAWLIHMIIEKSSSMEREPFLTELSHEMETFEKIITDLRNGNEALNIKPLEYKKAIIALNRLSDKYNNELKPILLSILSEVPYEKTKALLDKYDSKIHGYVYEIDMFVKFIEEDYKSEIREFKLLRIYALLLFALMSVFIVLYTRKSVVIPVLKLKNAASEIEKGNFDVSVDIRNRDEIGRLSIAFNNMAEKINEAMKEKSTLIKRQRILFETARTVISELDTKKILHETVEKARALIGSRYAALSIMNDRGGYESFISSGIDPKTCEDLKKRYSLPHGRGLLGHLLREGEPLRVDNISAHPAFLGFPEGHPQMKTFLGVPVKLYDRVIGRFYFADRQDGRPFTEEDEEIASAFSSIVAVAINNSRLLEELRRLSEEVLALNEASNSLIDIKRGEDIYQRICDIALDVFRLRMVWLGLIQEGTYDIKIVSVCGHDDGYLDEATIRWNDSSYGRGPTGMAIKMKKPVVVNDIEKDPYYAPWREKALKQGFRSSMAVPLFYGKDKLIGTLNLYSSVAGFFTKDRIRVFQAFANQAAIAIENVRLVEGLEERVRKRTAEIKTANIELKQLNKELELRRQEAEAANRAKSDFLANMSHELRTPLNAIIGFSEMMLMGMSGELNEKQKRYLTDIYESGEHLLSLINDILDLSKIETGRIDLEYENIDVQTIINESLIFIKEKALKHGIQVETVIEEGIGTIEADRKRLKQVLVNLLSNAAKFTPDGGSIRVKVRKVRQ